MEANIRFLNQPKSFWAYVRTISQTIGYTQRKTSSNPDSKVKIPSVSGIKCAFNDLGLDSSEIIIGSSLTEMGADLIAYFEYRADVLNNYVKPRLMDKDRARGVYEEIRSQYTPRMCDQPMNKQKGDKRAPAYLTCIINMLIEREIGTDRCDFDPRELTTITRDGKPLRTLARRVDGAFPSAVNPKAIWEIKEYYYTTTFGSRVADGVYETLLDGMELSELSEHEGVDVKHYLMVDDYYTWWTCGRSYLCRMIDMIHMGYVDEVLFGYEVVERLPDIVRSWYE